MKVLVLKAPKETLDDVDPFTEALRNAGMDAEELHVLSFMYVNQDILKKKIDCPENFGGLIFTSPRSVVAVAQCLEDNFTKSKWSALPFYVVGEGTAKVLKEKLGIEGTGQESGSAQNLSQFICKDVGGKCHKPLLFPCAELKCNLLADTLTGAGIAVDTVTTYKTVPHPHLGEILKENFCRNQGKKYILIFFSPSGINAVLPHLSNIDMNSCKMVAIGPTTESALKGHGLVVFATARQPSPSGLVQALQSALGNLNE